MTDVKKTYFSVAGGLLALGIILAVLGFAASGFNPAVFQTQIDLRSNSINFGGVEVDDPSGIPFVNLLENLGEIDLAAPEAPSAPRAYVK